MFSSNKKSWAYNFLKVAPHKVTFYRVTISVALTHNRQDYEKPKLRRELQQIVISHPAPPSYCCPSPFPWKIRPTLNHIHTAHGRCAYFFHMWGLRHSPICDCVNGLQTMERLITWCPKWSYSSDISSVHSTIPEATNWVTRLGHSTLLFVYHVKEDEWWMIVHVICMCK